MSDSKVNSRSGVINKLDLQIIKNLQKDGRMPYAQIARQLDVSTGMVRLHFKKLL